jgi:hypothetical protein
MPHTFECERTVDRISCDYYAFPCIRICKCDVDTRHGKLACANDFNYFPPNRCTS